MITILIIIIFFWINWVNVVYAINFSATWQGLESSDAASKFSQAYSFSFSHDISRTMTFSGSMRYSRITQEDTYRELITPSLFYSLSTDLFNYNLGFSSSHSKDNEHPDFKNYSITNTLFTKIKNINIRSYYNYGRTWNEASPRTIDNKEESWGLNLSRNFYEKYLKNLSLAYMYNFNRGKDLINGSKSETSTHTFNGRYSKNIKGLNISIEEKYSTSTTESWYTLVKGKAKIRVTLTTNGTIPNPLYDTDTIVVKLPSDRAIEGIEFYSDYSSRILLPSSVLFDIYYSNDGLIWNLLATNVSLPYSFSSPISYTWLKLVVKSGAGSPPTGGIDLIDPMIVGFYYITQGHIQTKASYSTTTGGISYNLPKGIKTSYFGYYEVRKSDPGNKRTDQNHSFYISWIGKPYFRPSLNYTFSKTKTENKPENKSYTLSLSIASTPISTVNLGLSYYNNRYYEGSTQIFQMHSYTFSGVFNIFPDLTLRSSLSYDQNHNYLSKIKQESYGSNIDIFMRLRPNLNADLRMDYTHAKNNASNATSTSSTNERYGIFIDWRVSDVLHFTTSQNINVSSDKTDYSFLYSIYFALWKKVRLSGSYSGSRDGEKTDNIGLSLFWDLGPHINFTTSYSWNKIANDTRWSWNWILNLMF